MRLRRFGIAAACALTCLSALFAFQRPFRELPGIEHRLGEIPLPPDYQEKTEWAFARLMFPPGPLNGYYNRDRDWHTGISLWSQDFPPADRHFSLAVRRLTRIHARSVEELVNLDEGDEYDWPWLYAVQVGEWGLTDAQGQALREYCLRGGFFFADDFHGEAEWNEFASRMRKAFPDHPIVELDKTDQLFHNVYDLDNKIQVVGWAHLRDGYKADNGPTAAGAHWRGILDDKGRIMVAITYNSDIGDAWEYADHARYPAAMADVAIRLGVNSIVYAMTH